LASPLGKRNHFAADRIGVPDPDFIATDPMTNAQEKRVNRIAAHKGFRLEKAGHGKGHGRFYIMNVAEGGRMRSDVPDHEYSFSGLRGIEWAIFGLDA
jgi:hypothetical protein